MQFLYKTTIVSYSNNNNIRYFLFWQWECCKIKKEEYVKSFEDKKVLKLLNYYIVINIISLYNSKLTNNVSPKQRFVNITGYTKYLRVVKRQMSLKKNNKKKNYYYRWQLVSHCGIIVIYLFIYF